DAAVLHALVLAAVALVVLHRTENLGAEETVAFGLERPVVDRLRLLHLAERPLSHLVGARQRDAQRVEGQRVLGLLEEIVEITQLMGPPLGFPAIPFCGPSIRRSTRDPRSCDASGRGAHRPARRRVGATRASRCRDRAPGAPSRA